MDDRTVLIASFGLGVAAQAALLIRNDWSWRKLATCAAFALIGFAPGRHEPVYYVAFHVLMCFSLFSFFFAVLFMRDILPLMSEAVLLSYTLVFWYAIFSYFQSVMSTHGILLCVLLAPTLLTLWVSLRKAHLGLVLKLILYCWFLVIVVSLGLLQFPFSQLALFFRERQLPWVTPMESAAAGMAFLYLLTNCTYVWYLIPLPSRSQTWAARMRQWHEFTDLLTQRFADASVTLVQVAIVLGAEGTALLLNAIYRWLPTDLVINVAIILPSIAFHPRISPATASAWSRR